MTQSRNHEVDEATNPLKPRERSLSATTQMKVSSPEMFIHAQGQRFHVREANIGTFAKGKNVSACRGLSPWRANELLFTELGRTDAFHGSRGGVEKATTWYVASEVGPIHSRGVDGVMSVEGLTHSKRSAVYRKEEA